MKPDIFELEHTKLIKAAQKAGIKPGAAIKQHKEEVLPYLNYIAHHIQPTHNAIRFAEIGVCYGGNFVLTGNTLEAFFQDTLVFGIGIDLPNQHRWGGHNINPRQTVKQLGIEFDHEIILGNSRATATIEQVKKLLGDEKLDLLFIDGDHSKAGCEADWNHYNQFVKSGGIIALHDTKDVPQWPHVEVWKVWQTLKKRYKHQEFNSSSHYNYGIGVLINE